MLKKWFMVIVVCLSAVLFIDIKIASAENNTIPLFFGSREVEPEIKVLDINGVRFINLPFLNKYLHIISKWDPDSGIIDLQFGAWSIKMNEDMGEYIINDAKNALADAPFEFKEQLWFPVEFLTQFGIVLEKETENELRLNWAQNYLLQIESINYQNRPAVLLIGTKNFQVTSGILATQPDRFMLDLSDLRLHPAFNNSIAENPTVKAIRPTQTSPETLRLIFDLYRLTGYKIVRDPAEPDQLMIVFNCFLEDVAFLNNEGELKIQIKTSFPTQYRVVNLVNPNRMVIDLEGTTVGKSFAPLPGDGEWVKSIRIAQFDPHTTRVVLDLIGKAPCFVIPSHEDPNLINIRTVSKITQISWSEDDVSKDGGGKLTIDANGELLTTLRGAVKPNKLWIDLDYAQFDPQLNISRIKSKYFKAIHLIPVNDSKVSIVLELNYYLISDQKISDNERHVTIYLKKSPLEGRTLVLDPGHGGVDVGTIGGQGTYEKDVNIEVAMRLKNLLEEIGTNVIFTRIDDSYISLFERPFIANFLLADVFVSIHSNSYTEDRNVRGIEVYYTGNSILGKLLAKKVLDKLSPATHFNGRGVIANDYAVLRESQMPSILIELGYLSNFQEEEIMKSAEFRDNAAQGILQGIIDYFNDPLNKS